MKAITINTVKMVAFAWVAALAIVGCGKSGDDGGQQIAAVPTYGYINGSCYNTAINQPVAANYCTGGVAGQYVWNGSQCVQTGTNTPVPQNYCNGTQGGYPNQYPNYQYGGTNPFPNGQYPTGYFPTGYPSFPGYGGTAGANQQSCVGIYFWMSGGYSRMVTCGGSNCSGYFMYSQSYQPILCL